MCRLPKGQERRNQESVGASRRTVTQQFRTVCVGCMVAAAVLTSLVTSLLASQQSEDLLVSMVLQADLVQRMD